MRMWKVLMMRFGVSGVLVVIAALWPGVSPAVGQQFGPPDHQPSSRDRHRGGRDSRGGSRDSGDRGRDGRSGGRPSTSTPEDRERFYDHMVERYMDRIGRNYELTEAQKPLVRAQLDQLKTQQRAFSEPRRQEFESLRQEMHQLHENARAGGQYDQQRGREISDRMRGMWQEAPLFNPQRVTEQVEKLLPPDQVERGRAKAKAEDRGWEQRRDEMRRRWQERQQGQNGQQPGGPQQPAQAPGWSPPPPVAPPQGGAETPSNTGRAHRDHGSRSGRSRGNDASSQQQYAQGYQQGSAASSDPRAQRSDGRRQPQGRPVVEDPAGPWERYMRDFIRRYQLDASQQATAQSVLRSAQETRTAYEQSRRADFQAAEQISDPGERKQRLQQLNEPVVQMFGQLKSRLDQIPTAAQRAAVDTPPAPATPPAETPPPAPAAGSQPAS